MGQWKREKIMQNDTRKSISRTYQHEKIREKNSLLDLSRISQIIQERSEIKCDFLRKISIFQEKMEFFKKKPCFSKKQ